MAIYSVYYEFRHGPEWHRASYFDRNVPYTYLQRVWFLQPDGRALVVREDMPESFYLVPDARQADGTWSSRRG